MKYLAYYRVSTRQQGKSGLGLAAQRKAVLNFLKGETPVMEFTDIESGKNNSRPELKKALEICKQNNYTLVIAKLDRLSRNLTFISSLMDAQIKFVCADMPEANEFTIHIFAALAQQERKMISERTKKALAAKKAQGFKLGKPENLTNDARIKGRAAYHNKAKENENNKKAFAFASSLKSQGFSYNKIANILNQNGFKTSKGKQFQSVQVIRLFKLYDF